MGTGKIEIEWPEAGIHKPFTHSRVMVSLTARMVCRV
jgi:hypothetical protein